MKRAKRIQVTLIIAFLCASLSASGKKGRDLPAPDPLRGSVGLSIQGEIVGSRRWEGLYLWPCQVYFAKLTENGDGYEADSVLPADVVEREQFFLLNAEPGRYAVVGAHFLTTDPTDRPFVRKEGTVYLALFSPEEVERTEVSIGPGETVFVGRMNLHFPPPGRLPGLPEEGHLRYSELIPSTGSQGLTPREPRQLLFAAKLARFERKATFESAFWLKAREVTFKKEPAWKHWADENLKSALARVNSDKVPDKP